MCVHFDAAVPRQCREDGAEDVKEKERPNFCDWFKPAAGIFDALAASAARDAERRANALFGGVETESSDEDAQLGKAEDLFR
jgi:hypothetical protein